MVSGALYRVLTSLESRDNPDSYPDVSSFGKVEHMPILQLPPTGSTVPTTETTENTVIPLSIPRIVLLGVCANLTILSSGFSFNAMSISLDKAARDLGIAEKDLQWTYNALYIGMARDHAPYRASEFMG
jgi:hypothetical protein